MGNTSPVSSSVGNFAGTQASNLNQVQGASSSLFGNILRKTEVAIGLKSQTGFSSGATYETQTLAGQAKATVNNAVNATKSLLHIK